MARQTKQERDRLLEVGARLIRERFGGDGLRKMTETYADRKGSQKSQ